MEAVWIFIEDLVADFAAGGFVVPKLLVVAALVFFVVAAVRFLMELARPKKSQTENKKSQKSDKTLNNGTIQS
jgi:hypothetical protein